MSKKMVEKGGPGSRHPDCFRLRKLSRFLPMTRLIYLIISEESRDLSDTKQPMKPARAHHSYVDYFHEMHFFYFILLIITSCQYISRKKDRKGEGWLHPIPKRDMSHRSSWLFTINKRGTSLSLYSNRCIHKIRLARSYKINRQSVIFGNPKWIISEERHSLQKT